MEFTDPLFAPLSFATHILVVYVTAATFCLVFFFRMARHFDRTTRFIDAIHSAHSLYMSNRYRNANGFYVVVDIFFCHCLSLFQENTLYCIIMPYSKKQWNGYSYLKSSDTIGRIEPINICILYDIVTRRYMRSNKYICTSISTQICHTNQSFFNTIYEYTCRCVAWLIFCSAMKHNMHTLLLAFYRCVCVQRNCTWRLVIRSKRKIVFGKLACIIKRRNISHPFLFTRRCSSGCPDSYMHISVILFTVL